MKLHQSLLIFCLVVSWSIPALSAEEALVVGEQHRDAVVQLLVKRTVFNFQKGKVTEKEGEVFAYGTAFIIKDNDGLWLVTANHVIETDLFFSRIFQVVYRPGLNREPSYVKLVAYDPMVDLALLKFDPDEKTDDLKSLQWGDSDELEEKQLGSVFAVINTYPFNWALTRGEVIVKNINFSDMALEIAAKKVTPPLRIMAHTAFAGRGSSGGPLLNKRGEVVGVNVMIFSDTIYEEGASTTQILMGSGSTPSNLIKKVWSKLKKGGLVEHWPPEVTFCYSHSLPKNELAKLGIAELPKIKGLMVAASKEGPYTMREKIGLRPGDLILDCNGRIPQNLEQLYEMIYIDADPNAKITFRVNRGGIVERLSYDPGKDNK